LKQVASKSDWQRALEKMHQEQMHRKPRKRPEPRAPITCMLPFDLYLALDDRAYELGVKKRDIILAGIKMALRSRQFRVK
jgi:hypothetical protein